MSLYYEATSFADSTRSLSFAAGTLKTRIYGSTNLKSKPSQVYALISQSSKWSNVLSRIIEKAAILEVEKKLSPVLAVLLCHDLLLTKTGIAAPKQHDLRKCIERHRARLHAEFTRARIRAGFQSVEAWREMINGSAANVTICLSESTEEIDKKGVPLLRWIRINTLKTTSEFERKSGVFSDYHCAGSISGLQNLSPRSKHLAVDIHIPDLIAVPLGPEISNHEAYKSGRIIFQNKSSCFPAILLDPLPEDRDIIDACAAPGNKTTHLVALLQQSRFRSNPKREFEKQKIYAVERDGERSRILMKLLKVAGASDMIDCLCDQDFLDLDPQDMRWRSVGALLLDPTCSGSGMVGRDEEDDGNDPEFVLPLRRREVAAQSTSMPSHKRKKSKLDENRSMPSRAQNDKLQNPGPIPFAQDPGRSINERIDHKYIDIRRVKSLSSFQVSLINHAFSFPSAHKVVYSTCSVYPEENEQVLMRVLQGKVAQHKGWRVLRREEQVPGMRSWKTRGDAKAMQEYCEANTFAWREEELKEMSEACLRCYKGTEERTMGFFVVGFVRDAEATIDGKDKLDLGVSHRAILESTPLAEDAEWEGFSDY